MVLERKLRPIKNKCKLCRTTQRLQAHHLSYEPEVIIYLCHICHLGVHNFSKIPKCKRIQALEMIDKYEKNWVNGRVKYRQGDYYKEYYRKYRKKWKDKLMAYQRKWMAEHAEEMKKYHHNYYEQNPEKFIKT